MKDYETLRLVFQAMALIISIGAIVYAHVRTRNAAQQEELKRMGERLTRSEARLEGTPTSMAMHELALSIANFGGELKALNARHDGLGAIVVRLEKVTNRQEDWIRDSSKGSNKGA